MRKTKIICTIGPASESEEKLRELINAGMNVARFNFSHGTYPEHETKGPEIRLRDFENGKITLEKGNAFTLTTEEVLGNQERASITYKDLPEDVQVGGSILIDDGLIELKVDSKTETEIHCTVVNGGPVSNHKGINVPGADLSMPFISAQDKSDIEFGCKMGFNVIAASFTRTARDIQDIREILNKNHSKMQIIAKIESIQGVNNIDEILEEADGVMVARGDLGVEVPLEKVPAIQKMIIHKAEQMGKQVVTATQMLDSMMHNPRPTRAETTDVANAIYDGTTAIMLSGETASGAYPVEAVKTMSKIAEATEADIDYKERLRTRGVTIGKTGITTAISHACCTISDDINADAIICVTISGYTARKISRYKPNTQIIACTTASWAACQMNLLFGVSPLQIGEEENADLLFESAVDASKRAGLIKTGDTVVLAAGLPLGISGNTNTIRVMEVW